MPCHVTNALLLELCLNHRNFQFFHGNQWNQDKEYGWLVVYLPLWKIWVRQLGLLFPIYGKKKKCSKPPTRRIWKEPHSKIHRNNQETKNDVNIWSPIPGNFNMESDDQRLGKKESWGLFLRALNIDIARWWVSSSNSVSWHMPLSQNPHTEEMSIKCITKKTY